MFLTKTFKMKRRALGIREKCLVVACVCAWLCGCAQTGIVSANQDSRVSVIVIHFTTEDFAKSQELLSQPSDNPVSSHYLIPELQDESYRKPRIQIQQLVPESRRAWHAGSSHWGGKTGLNDQSIGIELVNRAHCRSDASAADAIDNEQEPLCFYKDFDEAQISALMDLLGEILERHPEVKPTHIVGHSDIAPGRKYDPGPRFPWHLLARHGFGAWYQDDTVFRYWKQFKERPISVHEVQQALQIYGYGIDVTGNHDQQTRDVLRAFQAHFRPHQVDGELSAESNAILFALIENYFPERLNELQFL